MFLCQLAEVGAVFELLEQIERQFLFFNQDVQCCRGFSLDCALSELGYIRAP